MRSSCLGVIAIIFLAASAAASPVPPTAEPTKLASSLYPEDVVKRLRENAAREPWGARMREEVIKAAKPWVDRSDDELWALMFGPGVTRSWMVWSNGHCPACDKNVPMYEWICDALNKPWKVQCPHCREFFPKNDFQTFFASGLDKMGVFDPARADRSLLFNTEHPDPADPKHLFGVDDGEGCVAGDKRWRFIGAYEIYGQWKQAVLAGIRTLSATYLLTGDPICAHKAGLMLDRVADWYPLFDYKKQALVYERRLGSAGYVSIWHDACEETRELVMAYDMVFEAIREDRELVAVLSRKASEHGLGNSKASFADIQRNIEDRILRDAITNRDKIHSNYPRTELAIAIIYAVLGGKENQAAFDNTVAAMLDKATAVDGVTGEKGLAGYASYTIQSVAMFLAEFGKADPTFLKRMLDRHPRLGDTFRFHIDTKCLGRYYPNSGDVGTFGAAHEAYAGMPLPASFAAGGGLSAWACVSPSCYSLLWQLYRCTNDVAYLQTLYHANGDRVEGLPNDLYADDAQVIQQTVRDAIQREGPTIRLGSINKQQWHIAILRSGQGADARALWLDYDSGGGHGHADGMNVGLYANGLDLMPDFGYPPVQFGGWTSPRALWYTCTAAHETVVVDGQNTSAGAGETTLWFDGRELHAIRAAGQTMNQGRRFERTVALVDVSPKECYVFDVFRVAGGKDHAKFTHSHFGEAAATGLGLQPSADFGNNTQMRNCRMDVKPQPGWHVDWAIHDGHQHLPADSEVRLRHTDLTSDAQAGLIDAWVVSGGYRSPSDGIWIPRVLVRRQAREGIPLDSTFVSVTEPYATQPSAASIRRLSLQSADGKTLGDSNVALLVNLADGRRDVLIARDPEYKAAAGMFQQPDLDVRTDAELAFVRIGASGTVESATVCRGSRMTCGKIEIIVPAGSESVEWPGAAAAQPKAGQP